jgi:hypothetical protein
VASSNASNAAAAQIQQLHHALAEAEVQAEGFEKERDFYFESKFTFIYCGWKLIIRTENYRSDGSGKK